jgi:Ser/Thr protein kinase RdoA (MazF antagonist)
MMTARRRQKALLVEIGQVLGSFHSAGRRRRRAASNTA